MGRTLSLMGSIGVGAGLMYLLDPERGRRRRALLRDKLIHTWHKTGDAPETTATDAGNRAAGLVAETKARFRREAVSDSVLVERVRAKLGRAISHPRAITVMVDAGRVTLSGPIMADEVEEAVKAVASVRGVTGVDDRMVAHSSAEGVPALQGGRDRPGEAAANWSPTARLVAGAAGGALAAYGAKRRDAVGATLGTVGLGLLARGLTNAEIKRLIGMDGGRHAVDFQKTIRIDAPVDFVFQFWSNYENFPRFMSHVREVREIGPGRSHWVVSGPGGIPVEWDAELTELAPNRVIAWKSMPGAAIRQAGTIHFDPNPDGSTRLDIKLGYSPPAGAVGHAIVDLLGADPKHMMDEDLVRMKTLIETGHPPHDAAQPSSPMEAA